MADKYREKYYSLVMITPAQCRGARGLLDWTQADLKKNSGIGLSAIKSFERNDSKPITRNMEAIRKTFEANGIIFLPATETEGPGVRFATPDEAIQSRTL